jgi:methanogenic corrinoid protein MtbC1
MDRNDSHMKTTSPSPNDLSIGAVERETGLSKDTLRVWERRYDFPSPGRDEFGERSYPPDQVEKLRLIKNLMDHGHRPGKLAGNDIDVLRGMVAQPPSGDAGIGPVHGAPADLLHYIALCKAHRIEELRSELTQSLLRLGIYRFVTDVVAPLTTLVGAHWATGNLAVFEEHLYTESVHVVMRNAIAAIPPPDSQTGTSRTPRIVLTTIPQEPHGLGLLMAEAILALEGARCLSLGVQTPVNEIAQAAKVHAADIVALSFSASARSASVLEALADLRTELPPAVEIWVGGRCGVLRRRRAAAVKRLELHDIPGALAAWRKQFLR